MAASPSPNVAFWVAINVQNTDDALILRLAEYGNDDFGCGFGVTRNVPWKRVDVFHHHSLALQYGVAAHSLPQADFCACHLPLEGGRV